MKRTSLIVGSVAVLLLAVACSGGADEDPTDPPPTEYVRQRAPIDGFEITNDESVPPKFVAHITSGLPSGCVTFDSIETTRDGNTFAIDVWNLAPAPGELIPCTMIYGSVQNTVTLDADFEPGAEYGVNVNDVVRSFTVPSSDDDDDAVFVRQRAPIDGVEITIAESFPPQYFVRVTSGLPSGCVTFDAIETTRDGNTIEIAVWNLGPGPDATFACTAIYGIVENNVALGTDFESGAEYRVEVNDVVEMFTAQ